MARKRMIDPAFFLDEEVASLSAHARLLYIGSWTLADDVHFTLPKRPDWIKAQIFPYEMAIDVGKLIEDLVGIGKYIPFSNGENKEYLFIPTMAKHQTINRPSAPKYPPHPEASKYISECSMSAHSQYNISKEKLIEYNEKFEAVWSEYPNKVGKEIAFKHFQRTVTTDEELGRIKVALSNYIQSKRVKDGFVMDGKRWFGDWEGWFHMKPKVQDPMDKWMKPKERADGRC